MNALMVNRSSGSNAHSGQNNSKLTNMDDRDECPDYSEQSDQSSPNQLDDRQVDSDKGPDESERVNDQRRHQQEVEQQHQDELSCFSSAAPTSTTRAKTDFRERDQDFQDGEHQGSASEDEDEEATRGEGENNQKIDQLLIESALKSPEHLINPTSSSMLATASPTTNNINTNIDHKNILINDNNYHRLIAQSQTKLQKNIPKQAQTTPMQEQSNNQTKSINLATTTTTTTTTSTTNLTPTPKPTTIMHQNMHVCQLCDKLLSSSSSLDRHMLTHSGERPFVCKRCHMTFTTNGNMHRHMRTHLHKEALAKQQQEEQLKSLANTIGLCAQQHQHQLLSPGSFPIPSILEPASAAAAAATAAVTSAIGQHQHQHHHNLTIPTNLNQQQCNITSSLKTSTNKNHIINTNNININHNPPLHEQQATISFDLLSSPQNQLPNQAPSCIPTTSSSSTSSLFNTTMQPRDQQQQLLETAQKLLLQQQQQQQHHQQQQSPLVLGQHQDTPLLFNAFDGIESIRTVMLAAAAAAIQQQQLQQPNLFGLPTLDTTQLHQHLPGLMNFEAPEDNNNIIKSLFNNNVNESIQQQFPQSHNIHNLDGQLVQSQQHKPLITGKRRKQINPRSSRHQQQIVLSSSTSSSINHDPMICSNNNINIRRINENDENSSSKDNSQDSISSCNDHQSLSSLKINHHQDYTTNNNNNNNDSNIKDNNNNEMLDSERVHSEIDNQTLDRLMKDDDDDNDDQEQEQEDDDAMNVVGDIKMMNEADDEDDAQNLVDSNGSNMENDVVSVDSTLMHSRDLDLDMNLDSNEGVDHNLGDFDAAGDNNLESDLNDDIDDDDEDMDEEGAIDISQSYVKTPNPHPNRKGGKRNRNCYKCKLCPYSSVDRCTLVRHLRIHSGERPYICGLCRYAFTTKANCERHVRKRHKKQYNDLGGSGGVKGSDEGGRSLIITDHSNHETIPNKVNPAAAQTISQKLQKVQEKQQQQLLQQQQNDIVADELSMIMMSNNNNINNNDRLSCSTTSAGFMDSDNHNSLTSITRQPSQAKLRSIKSGKRKYKQHQQLGISSTNIVSDNVNNNNSKNPNSRKTALDVFSKHLNLAAQALDLSCKFQTK